MGCTESVAVKQTSEGDELLPVAPNSSRQQQEGVATTAGAPHQGLHVVGAVDNEEIIGEATSTLFGSKHVILSYQWDVQEQVVLVCGLLKARGIPTWMDVDGYAALPVSSQRTRASLLFMQSCCRYPHECIPSFRPRLDLHDRPAGECRRTSTTRVRCEVFRLARCPSGLPRGLPMCFPARASARQNAASLTVCACVCVCVHSRSGLRRW